MRKNNASEGRTNLHYVLKYQVFKDSLLFLVLGLSSIVAAIKYTVGKSAYGYSGFGDVFVFLTVLGEISGVDFFWVDVCIRLSMKK